MTRISSIFYSLALMMTVSTVPNNAFAAEKTEQQVIEIFTVLPGKHEAFLEFVTLLDDIYVEIGLEPRTLYVHSTGEGYDYMFFQPASMDPVISELYSQKLEENNVPAGHDFFAYFREFLSTHNDAIVNGPTTAKEMLHSLRENRAKRIAREQTE